LIGLATLLRVSLADILIGYPFLLSYPILLLSSFLFGWGYSLYALALTLPVVFYFIDPHPVGVALFLVGAIAAICLIESLVQIVERLDEAHRNTEDLLREKESLLRQQELLLLELNHRVKNNLQVISSMLMVHRAQLSSEEARDALAAAGERIAVVGRIHDRLYQQPGALTLNANELIEELCAGLKFALAHDRPITFDIEVEPVPLSVGRAALLGLLINELVINALKHAFPGDRPGTLMVRFGHVADHRFCLVVADDGVGCSATQANGIGLTLVGALAQQLDGTFTREDAKSGYRITLHLPAEEPRCSGGG
jgi:two-component system, sensor histidine kinase PdtaS